jgi:DNA (cytosine-5)-methyltransferase 1
MKLGGLFSGVGGFELAWTQLGHEVAWMCEWDAKARKVLEARFPGVPIYPDVRDLDPAEVEAVDVLTGGSPCQGFSIAGQRTGLEHSESKLFADYVRIMDGLAERGLKYAIWENVPGVLSIRNEDGERTFTHVVGALGGGNAPVRLDPKRKWNAGLVANGGRAVSWRVLDSRHFGVAQRRRRVFACVAFGDFAADRAGRTLLAVAEGVRGDSPSGVPAREGVAGGVEGRVGVPSVAPTVTSKWAKGVGGPAGSAAETGNMVVDAKWWDGGQTADSLTTTSDAQRMPDKRRFQAVIQPQAFRKASRAQSSEDAESSVENGQANTLNVFDVGDTRTTHAMVEPKEEMVDFGRTSDRIRINAETAATLQSGGGGSGANTGLYMQEIVEPTLAPSLTASNDPSRSPQSSEVTQQVAAINSAGHGVRRLTPVECERLQSFPDGWTEPAGSDSARYKAMGNAVTVNVVRWILGRMP